MTYETVEDALLTTLIEISGLDSFNTSKNDFAITNNGNEYSVILAYQGFDQIPRTISGPTTRNWTIAIYLFVQYYDDVSVNNTLRDLRESILNKVQVKPQLGSSAIFDSEIISGRRMEPQMDGEENISMFGEELICLIQEISSQTIVNP